MSAVLGEVPLSFSGPASEPLICPLPFLHPGEWSEWAGEAKEREKNFGLYQVLDDEANAW